MESLATDRSHVINTSYVYNVPDLYHGDSKFVHGATQRMADLGDDDVAIRREFGGK